MCFHEKRLIKAIQMRTQNTIFNIKKKGALNYPKSAGMGFFPRDSRMSLKQLW